MWWSPYSQAIRWCTPPTAAKFEVYLFNAANYAAYVAGSSSTCVNSGCATTIDGSTGTNYNTAFQYISVDNYTVVVACKNAHRPAPFLSPAPATTAPATGCSALPRRAAAPTLVAALGVATAFSGTCFDCTTWSCTPCTQGVYLSQCSNSCYSLPQRSLRPVLRRAPPPMLLLEL